MNHPFIKNKQLLYAYLAVWLVVIVLHAIVLYVASGADFYYCAIDSIVFNVLFCLLGLALWYPVEFYRTKDPRIVNLIINHLSVLAFTGLIWLGVSYNVMNFISNSGDYSSFLYESLLLRGISGVFFYAVIVLLYYVLSYYRTLQEQISNEVRLRELLKTAELNFLKAQINPHFLFNSLNSISSLTITNPTKAREMIIKLSDFLRYVISRTDDKPVRLSDEIDNIARYLDIEKVRFGDKLSFTFDIQPEAQHLLLPVLLLQPLYENAVKHGVYESTEPIVISTAAYTDNNNLIVSISNNYEPAVSNQKGAGIGISNIRERLRLLYANNASLRINDTGKLFDVNLVIPQ